MEDVGSWSDNWELFVDELERRAQHGDTTEELAQYFGGATVRWKGIIEHVDIDEPAPGVEIRLPRKVVKLADGGKVSLDGLGMSVSDSAVDNWRALKVGSAVRFQATFAEGTSVFPPVEIKTLKSGRSVILIQLCNAVPITS
jgi:hypothetical protein